MSSIRSSLEMIYLYLILNFKHFNYYRSHLYIYTITNLNKNRKTKTTNMESIKGLPNIGNSCYFNSSIQLCKLISGISFADENNEQNCFINDIQSLFQTENNQEEWNKYLKLYSFVSSNLEYPSGSQQDSCEVVQFILDKYVELNKNKNKLLSVFNQIIFCSNCNKYRISNEQKESMLISHELNNNSKEEIDFQEFFDNIISLQDVDNLNTECNCESPKAKVQTIFTSLPEYLFIKVGRCGYDTNKIYKNLKIVHEFDIDYPIDLEKSMNKTDMRKITNYYRLIGILIHHGNTSNSGHYASIVKMNDDWIYCDDGLISKINIDNDIEYIEKNCCILVYKTT
jgi:ubiquitin C-terminal hydrolase